MLRAYAEYGLRGSIASISDVVIVQPHTYKAPPIPMLGLSPATLREALAVARLKLLFSKVPTGIVSALVGVFVLFVLLLDMLGADKAKAWAAYMLGVLGFRGWLWYMAQSAHLTGATVRRWEAALAVSALLMGVGWAQLSILYFPDVAIYGRFMLVTAAIVVALSGTATYGLSHAAFWAVTLPTLLPAFYRFHYASVADGVWPAYTLALCIMTLGLVAMLQLSQRSSMLENLRRRIESEALLAEQNAIFQSTTLGIAVLEQGQLVKANGRFGEMLGRRVHELLELPLETHLANRAELDALLGNSNEMFLKGKSFHGAYRLRRADGSEFWAEMSGRRMEGSGPERSVWLIGEAPLRRAG